MKHLARGVTAQRGVLTAITSGLQFGRLALSHWNVPPVAAQIRIGNKQARIKGKESSMDRELIIRLAREAELWEMLEGYSNEYVSGNTEEDCLPDLERFAALVAAHEREECAKMAEAFHRHGYDFTGDAELHEAIRSRT